MDKNITFMYTSTSTYMTAAQRELLDSSFYDEKVMR